MQVRRRKSGGARGVGGASFHTDVWRLGDIFRTADLMDITITILTGEPHTFGFDIAFIVGLSSPLE
jgi:hypothetical protein